MADIVYPEELEQVTTDSESGHLYLTSLFRSGLSYGSVNLARSALSSSLPYLDGKAVGQHPVICKILKGMYNRRPQQSRYSSTWDVDVLLEYIREMSPLSILPLRELTRKMVMLMLLTSCQRVQTLNTLNVSDPGAYAGFSEGGCREGGGGVPRSAKEANNPILLKVQSLQLSFRPAGVSLGGGGGGQGPPGPPPCVRP